MQSTLKIQRTSFVSLKTKCKPVEFGDPYSLQKIGVELCNLLVNTKYHSLSANQCGMTYSIFCCRVNSTFTTYFNPELIDIGRDGEYDMIEGKEVCQCFPSMQYTVKRPNVIRVQYKDYMGNNKMTWLYDLSARFWLKGFDHVNALTAYDRDNNTKTELPEDMRYA